MQQQLGQVVPFPPAWRRHQLGQMPGAGMVAQAFMPTVQNWLGNVFGSGNRPAIEDIKAALELGQTISAESWAQAGLPPDGGQWYQDWLLQHDAMEATWRRQAGLPPDATIAAPVTPTSSALSQQVAILQAQIAALSQHADYQQQSGNLDAADAYDREIAAMHRQMQQMQAMLNRTLAANQRQMVQQFQLQQQQQQQQPAYLPPVYVDVPPADDAGAGGWPFDDTQTMYIAAGLAGVGLLILLSGRNGA